MTQTIPAVVSRNAGNVVQVLRRIVRRPAETAGSLAETVGPPPEVMLPALGEPTAALARRAS